MTILLAMAGLGIQFNAGQHAERSIDPVPDGWYVAQIVNSEVKPTKTPGGARLNLQFKILQGDFAGRVVFGGYNIQNSNPVAVQIAMEELAELSRAVNVPVWNDTEQLHGIPLNLKVKIKKSEGYNDSNEPAQYKLMSDMAGVRYATKADIKQGAAPVGNAFGSQQPTQQQPQQTQQQPQGWGNNTQQQPTQQQQPVQTQQQPVQQEQPQQGAVNFQQAAGAQPWGQNTQQQPVQEQPQQTAQQPVQEQQPVQQQQVQQQPQQQAVQQEQPVQQQNSQPGWAQTQVQPGTEQQPQQQNNAQQVVEQPDDIQQAAQSQTPPWKTQAQ